jgi:hypothetical protein
VIKAGGITHTLNNVTATSKQRLLLPVKVDVPSPNLTPPLHRHDQVPQSLPSSPSLGLNGEESGPAGLEPPARDGELLPLDLGRVAVGVEARVVVDEPSHPPRLLRRAPAWEPPTPGEEGPGEDW